MESDKQSNGKQKCLEMTLKGKNEMINEEKSLRVWKFVPFDCIFLNPSISWFNSHDVRIMFAVDVEGMALIDQF